MKEFNDIKKERTEDVDALLRRVEATKVFNEKIMNFKEKFGDEGLQKLTNW